MSSTIGEYQNKFAVCKTPSYSAILLQEAPAINKHVAEFTSLFLSCTTEMN